MNERHRATQEHFLDDGGQGAADIFSIDHRGRREFPKDEQLDGSSDADGRRVRFDVRYECALRVHLASQMQPSIQTIKYAAAAIAMCVRGAGEQMRRRSDMHRRTGWDS